MSKKEFVQPVDHEERMDRWQMYKSSFKVRSFFVFDTDAAILFPNDIRS